MGGVMSGCSWSYVLWPVSLKDYVQFVGEALFMGVSWVRFISKFKVPYVLCLWVWG